MKYLNILLIILFFSSCAKYTQQEYGESNNMTQEHNVDSIYHSIDTSAIIRFLKNSEQEQRKVIVYDTNYPSPAPYDPSYDDVGGEGVINYALNDTMIVGVTNEVNVTISKESDKTILLQEIPEFNENNLVTDSIRIAPVMKARLVDPTGVNFRIISRTSEEQFIERDDYTRWIWDVTPLKEGDNKLSLTVDIVVNDKSKSINVYDGEIYVYSDETFFQKIIAFLSKNWEFLLSTILIPLFVFLYKKYKKPAL